MVYAILYAGQIKTILFLNEIKKGAIGAFFDFQLYSLFFILYSLCSMLYALYSILSTLYSNKNCRLATSD